MSTIFQMSRDELVSLLVFLRPHHSDAARRDELDARYLRILITEWLLLNGLSTLHKFERATGAKDDGADTSGATTEWHMPSKVDCTSCGKFRVGKSVYETEAAPLPITVTQPTPQRHFASGAGPTPLLCVNDFAVPSTAAGGGTPPVASRPIRTKHGNLQRVHYGVKRELTPAVAAAPTTRSSFDGSASSLHHDKQASFQRYSGAGRHANYVYYGDGGGGGGSGYDSARGEDKCADMCLVCLLCECAPPSEALKKRRATKANNNNNINNNHRCVDYRYHDNNNNNCTQPSLWRY